MGAEAHYSGILKQIQNDVDRLRGVNMAEPALAVAKLSFCAEHIHSLCVRIEQLEKQLDELRERDLDEERSVARDVCGEENDAGF